MKLGDPIYYYTRGDGPFVGIITEVLQANMINATIFPPCAAPYSVGCVMTEGGPIETWQTLNNCWATPVDAPKVATSTDLRELADIVKEHIRICNEVIAASNDFLSAVRR